MAKRIHDIAKELGINSKVIIDKCVAEGVPPENVKNHMAVIKAGLEASIREWFSTGTVATAVETTQHVDVEKVKAKPARRKITKAEGGSTNGDGGEAGATGTSVAEPEVKAPAAPAPIKTPPPDTGHATVIKTRTPPAPHAPVPPTLAPTPVGPGLHRTKPPEGPLAPTTPAAPIAAPAKPPETGGGELRPAAATPAPARPPTPPARTLVTPAPMNVPDRPKNVAPAGPQLQIKQQVKLSGPKVVRVEAPEPADTRGPRRPSPGGPGSLARGGRGVVPGGTGGGGADDDQSRSPRRNKRRGPGGPAEAPGVPARRRAKGAEEIPTGNAFSEQDLIEREARLSRAGGYLRQRRRELKAKESASGEKAHTPAELGGKVEIVAPFTIKELAAATGIKSSEIIKKLFLQNIMATANSGIDVPRAQEIMIDFDLELVVKEARTAEQVVSDEFTDRTKIDERPRPPVVTIMGHVDHGKTSLLDKIRSANVAAGEAGGITQKTSAFRVPVQIGGETKHIVFLDTPGHQAFTEMRARGANLTDVIVLVVGAPEGVMPQTVESINHAKAAKVPIVVALNKIDSPQATENQIQKIYGQLAEQGLNPTAWGGQTEVVKTSALKGDGIQELLEVLDLQAQMLELKADFGGPARGRVIEASLDEGRGPIATILVQDGELKIGDYLVAGHAFGRVRDIADDQGKKLKSAGPAMPVQISGLDKIPGAGDTVFVADSLRKAEEAAEQRGERDRIASLHQPKVTLDSLFSQMKDANVKEILTVLKADAQGSVDVIKYEIERLSTAEVKIRVLHAAVGGITESDVLLADASRAVIVGFNVIATHKATQLAEVKGVEIRTYQVIYDITDDVKKAASGLLEPEIRQEVLGHAEVRKVFKVTKVGNIAGCYVTDGIVQRDAFIRVTRQGVIIENERVLDQLKRLKDDAKEVRAGMECGMKIAGYDDIKEGDILECYKKIEVKRTL